MSEVLERTTIFIEQMKALQMAVIMNILNIVLLDQIAIPIYRIEKLDTFMTKVLFF